MVTVLDSKDLITHLTTGEMPVPAGVAEDNARQQAAADKGKSNGKQAADVQRGDKSAAEALEKGAETAAGKEGDDLEGDDGLTPRQKRELSASMLKAIGKKHRQVKEAEEFAADQYNNRRLAEQRAEAAERRAQELEGKQQAAKVEEVKEPVEPQRAQFQTDEQFTAAWAKYRDDLIDYRVDQRLKKQQADDAKARAAAEQAAIVSAAQERLSAAAKLVRDFEETIDTDLNVPGHIAAYMQRSPLFAELGYHFAKHPEVLAELRKLTPAEALVEVGVIKSTLRPFSETHTGEGKASNGSEPSKTNGATPSTQTGDSPSKPRGTAPVITPLSAGSTSQVEKAPEQMSTREMITDWQKKNGRNLGLRKRH